MANILDKKMKLSFCFTCCVFLACINVCTVYCAEENKCNFVKKPATDEENKLISRLSVLNGQKYDIGKDSTTYRVSICGDVIPGHPNASVVLGKEEKDLVVFGRRNDTQISGGVSWILLMYGSGDISSTCSTPRKSSVLVMCDQTAADHHEQSHTMILLGTSNPCNAHFLLSTPAVCTVRDSLSGAAIFCILVLVIFGVYFIIGILYRRMAFNSQGCRQLPHFTFWSKFGGLCADGCNYMCRCEDQREDSWNTITSNFDTQDRDDALLRP